MVWVTDMKKNISQRKVLKTRIALIFLGFIILTLLEFVRLYFLQVANYERFTAMAQGQYVSRNSHFFDRGNIFFKDRNGGLFSVAAVASGYKIAINPKKIENPDTVFNKLSKYINLNEKTFFKKATKKDDPYEEVAFKIEKEVAEKIAEEKISGVILVPQRWRVYPAKNMAAQTIGFLAYGEDGKLSGRYGLEKYYNDTLSRDDKKLKVNFFAAMFKQVQEWLSEKEVKGDIVTSIDPTVQKFLTDTLSSVKNDEGAEFAAGIIMKSQTGEIVALGSVPDFDLNNFQKENPALFKNLLVENVYEMGSIIKPVTIAAGVDAGVINKNSTYNDKGYVVVDGHKIYNYDKKGRGKNTTMSEVLAHSLNTGVVFVMQKLGKERFRDYFLKLDLAQETGIDLPYEASNLIENLYSPRNIEYATASFGQGIALTPISAIRALNAVATGYLVQPHVVVEIQTNTGLAYKKDYFDMRTKVFSDKATKTVASMLVEAVDKTLKGGKLSIKEYSIAVKTGTAQVSDGKGGYLEDGVLHTFVGYFPAYDPEYTILLMLMKPQEHKYSSQTLSVPFFDIVKFLINYYDIKPDRI